VLTQGSRRTDERFFVRINFLYFAFAFWQHLMQKIEYHSSNFFNMTLSDILIAIVSLVQIAVAHTNKTMELKYYARFLE
jgi:hypothetical protein